MSLKEGIQEALLSEEGRKELAEKLEKTYSLFFYGAEEALRKIGTESITGKRLLKYEPEGAEILLDYSPYKSSFRFYIKKRTFKYKHIHRDPSVDYCIDIRPIVKNHSVTGVQSSFVDIELAQILWRNPSKIILDYAKRMDKKEEKQIENIKEFFELPPILLDRLNARTERQNQGVLDKFLLSAETDILRVMKPVEAYLAGDEKFKGIMGLISEEQKKQVLSQIFDIKKANKAFDEWLSKNYSSLIDQVGRDRLYLK